MAETTTIAVSPINPKFRSQSVADEATTPEKKTRPRKAPQRRSYQAENAELNNRITMALRVIKRGMAAEHDNGVLLRELALVAVETLEGR